MKTVYIPQNSQIEQTLAWILPELAWDISVVSHLDNMIDLQIIDLDHYVISTKGLICSEPPPILALTFEAQEKIKFARGLAISNSQKVKFIRMPFLLGELKESISADSESFDIVYRHPGINLLYCLREDETNNRNQYIKVIEDLYQDLWVQSANDLDTFLTKLPLRIITDFYVGLAHDRDRAGFEGLLSSLAATANDYREENDASWYRFDGTMGIVSEQGAPIHEDFQQKNDDYEVLLTLIDSAEKSVINDFHIEHCLFQKRLEDLLNTISTSEINTSFSRQVASLF